MFLLNSRLTHFTAARQSGHPFFRSYGARLPSSLTRFHSCALVYFTHPPVSVYGTGSLSNDTMSFSWQIALRRSASAVASTSACAPLSIGVISPQPRPHRFKDRRCRNINLLSIVYALRPRLRSRLTLGGRTLPRKPWVYGGQEFHLSYRYSCLHSHFSALHRHLPSGFNALRTLPYHSVVNDEVQSFGIPLIANHFRRRITR